LCAATLRMCTWRATTMASAANQSSVNGMWASLSATGSWRVAGHSASTAASPKTAVSGSASSAADSNADCASTTAASPRSSAGEARSTNTSSGAEARCLNWRNASASSPATRLTSAARSAPASASRTKSSSRSATTPMPPPAALRASALPGVSSSWNSWWYGANAMRPASPAASSMKASGASRPSAVNVAATATSTAAAAEAAGAATGARAEGSASARIVMDEKKTAAARRGNIRARGRAGRAPGLPKMVAPTACPRAATATRLSTRCGRGTRA